MKVAVTGASGFLGRHLVEALLAEGHEVRALSRRASPELERLGAHVVIGDLANREALREAFKERELVFHTAAKTGVWGPRREYELTNVAGTESVLSTCQVRRVPKLVFTSSPSVVFGDTDQVDASNDLPYPKRYLCAYAATKATAEQLVLSAHGKYGLATCALRPHLIFGARDPHLIPRLIERAQAGKLVRVGSGRNRVTLCAVENAVHAHLLAARSLASDAPHAGRAYFIGQEQSVELWPWIDALLARVHAPPIRRSLSASSAYALGATLELLWKLRGRSDEPPLTRFVARQLALSHSYDMRPARDAFGYREIVSTAAAVDAVVAAFDQR